MTKRGFDLLMQTLEKKNLICLFILETLKSIYAYIYSLEKETCFPSRTNVRSTRRMYGVALQM